MLVEILTAGICGTDLDIARGARPDAAEILGHEGVGRIVQADLPPSRHHVGQRVVFNPVDPTQPDRVLGHSFNGIFQEVVKLDASDVERGMVLPLDPDIPDELATLTEPLGTVMYGQSLVAQAINPHVVAVVGAGPIGLLNALEARLRGAERVYLIDILEERLQWAVEQGVVSSDEALVDSDQIPPFILEETRGVGVDAIYLCTPRWSAMRALSLGLTYLRDGGCVDLVVGFRDGSPAQQLPRLDLNRVRRANTCGSRSAGIVYDTESVSGRRVLLTGHRGTSEGHLRQAVSRLIERPTVYGKVISQSVSMDEAPTMLNRLLGVDGVPTAALPGGKVIIRVGA